MSFGPGITYLIDILPPIPPEINQSYIPFGYYNFGCFCWIYEPATGTGATGFGVALGSVFQGGYDGEVEWINTLHRITQPKYPNPIGIRTYFKPGVVATLTPLLSVDINVPDLLINGVKVNPATGKGMPILIQ